MVIENNIIDSAGVAGINLTGDADTDAQGHLLPTQIVSFSRIVNNTIYGGGSGIGIAVSKNSSPTLLNNILSNLSVGVAVDSSSSTTVLGSNLYQNNSQTRSGPVWAVIRPPPRPALRCSSMPRITTSTCCNRTARACRTWRSTARSKRWAIARP